MVEAAVMVEEYNGISISAFNFHHSPADVECMDNGTSWCYPMQVWNEQIVLHPAFNHSRPETLETIGERWLVL